MPRSPQTGFWAGRGINQLAAGAALRKQVKAEVHLGWRFTERMLTFYDEQCERLHLRQPGVTKPAQVRVTEPRRNTNPLTNT